MVTLVETASGLSMQSLVLKEKKKNLMLNSLDFGIKRLGNGSIDSFLLFHELEAGLGETTALV